MADEKPNIDASGADALKAREAQIAQLNADLAKVKGEHEKLAKADKERKDKDAASKGEYEKLLAERTAELEGTKKQQEALMSSLGARADSLLKKLPKEKQEKVEKYKDKLSLVDWLDMIESESVGEEAETSSNTGGTAHNFTPGGGHRPAKTRELAAKSYEVMETLGLNPEMAEKLKAIRNPDNPAGVKFTMPIMEMREHMKIGRGVQFTHENATNRKR